MSVFREVCPNFKRAVQVRLGEEARIVRIDSEAKAEEATRAARSCHDEETGSSGS
jgi:hypothetical protein